MANTDTKKYYEAVGRRKTASARVRLFESSTESVTINDRDMKTYFSGKELVKTITKPLKTASGQKFKVTAKIKGGGVVAQSEALRHGISRALILYSADLRTDLKKKGFLRRDPRMKERKKFGLKKARRAPQWSKR